jgi:hypothetical protein
LNQPHRAGLFTALTIIATCQASPAWGAPQDRWFQTSMADLVIGHAHESVEVLGDSLVVTTVESRVGVERLGQSVDIEETSRWVETVGGAARSCRISRRLADDEEIIVEVTVEPGRLIIEKSTARGSDMRVVPVDGEIVFLNAIARLHAERGFKAGDSYGYDTFDPDFENVCRVAVTVIGPDTLAVAGELRVLHALAVARDLYDGVVVHEWRDDDGELWIEDAAALGITNTRTTADRAAEAIDRADMLTETLIKCNARIRDARRVDEALYELSLEGGDVAEILIEDARQKIEGRTTEGGVLLRVRRVVPEPGTTADVPMAAADLGEFMKDNVFLQTGDPAVVAAANDAVASAGADSWERALMVERRVSRLMTSRSLGTAFASAAEALGAGSGDCTEHAVLAAAMARAVGVPSRVVTGVVHFDGSFAYHMWVEVWTGNQWHALDPTIGDGSVDATHIKLGESSLPDGCVAELSLGILRTMKRLGIRVVEYAASGKMIRGE